MFKYDDSLRQMTFQQPEPQEQQPEYKPPSAKVCPWCSKPIWLGDRAVTIDHGILGRGKKSGQPVVIEDRLTSGEATLHELCSIAWLSTNVVDSSDEVEGVIDTITADIFGISYSELASEETLCAVCEEKIDGD